MRRVLPLRKIKSWLILLPVIMFVWLSFGSATPAIIAQGQQPERGVGVRPAGQTSARRIALVIGNGVYTAAPALKNPPNDAREMAAALRSLGFDVSSAVDAGQRQMKQLIREFGQKLKGGAVGLFYYAGHGVQSKGRNYLIPVDADIQSETDVEDLAVDVNLVLGLMDEAGNGLNIVILDACRNNPFARSFRSATNGLAQMSAPTGTLIAYATAPGGVASDGDGRNGLYTTELLKQMKEPGVPIEIVFKRVGTRVSAATSGRQEPWIALSLRGDFYFVAGSNTSAEQASSVSTSPPITFNQPPSATGPAGGSGTSYQEANAIATKDIGSLRVVLKSVMPMKLKDQNGRSVNGIRCSFEFMNRETQRPIAAAMHAWPSGLAMNVNPYGETPGYVTPYGGYGTQPGNALRTTLLDERGTVWSLSASGVTGINIVSVGKTSRSTRSANPAEIGSLLQRQDETGTNENPDIGYAFVFGSTTPIPPGESVTVVMSFVQDAGETTSGPLPKFFQISSEIVVGVVKTGTKKSYSLHNVIFDRVSMPADGSSSNHQEANAMATKDIGSLPAVLKSVMAMQLKDQNGQRVDGIRCSFEFVNRDTQRPIVVAMNATRRISEKEATT